MGVRVRHLSNAQLDEIGNAIGDAFYDYDYGGTELGLVKYIKDRARMVQYMQAIFTAGVKSGMVYSVSERGEGYILISSTRGDRMKLLPALGMLRGMCRALGGFRNLRWFWNESKRGGSSLEEKMKRDEQEFLKIEMLVVRKEYQQQGYMRKLMEIAYEKADRYGVPCILDTDARNKSEKYCHLGMRLAATRKLADDCILYDLIRKPT